VKSDNTLSDHVQVIGVVTQNVAVGILTLDRGKPAFLAPKPASHVPSITDSTKRNDLFPVKSKKKRIATQTEKSKSATGGHISR